jgi:CelD/BcsL family acetyltransferase involved in cellulose biosynthesis
MTFQITATTTRETGGVSAPSLYDSDRWLAVVRDGFGVSTSYLTICEAAAIQAQFPLMTQRKGPFTLAGSPLRGTHSEFGGSMVAGADQAALMLALHRYLRKQGASWIELTFDNGGLDSTGQWALAQCGYDREEKHSLLVDLSVSLDDIWMSFAGRARTEVRKAEKNSMAVVRLGPEHCQAYDSLVAQVFANQKRQSSFDQRFLDAVHRHLSPRNFAHYGVFNDGQLVAGGLFFTDRDRMVFVSGASDQQARRLGVNSLIQWHAIQHAVQAGVTHYDMGGTGVGAIDKFKASFGGQPVTYDRYVYRTIWAGIPAAIYKMAHARGWL